MKKNRNIFWGLMFMLGAVALVIGKMGYLEGIGFWSIVFTIGLLGTLIDGLYRRSWGGILFSLAFLATVNSKTLGIEELTPWTVLGAALLGTIGLNIVFPSKKKWNNVQKYVKIDRDVDTEEYAEIENEDASKTIHYGVYFGSTVKYLKCDSLKKVDLGNVFGSLDVYFTDSILQDHAAHVNAEIVFGRTKLYIPADWRVVCSAETVFGHVEENGRSNPAGENVLTVHGEAVFGTLEIYYI